MLIMRAFYFLIFLRYFDNVVESVDDAIMGILCQCR